MGRNPIAVPPSWECVEPLITRAGMRPTVLSKRLPCIETEMMMPPITRTLLAALLVSTTALAGGIHTERVHFAKGANSATIEGRIQGDMTIDYLLGARKGQTMNVSMATDNGANYFNIIAPGKENEAMFVGSSSGNQFEGRLPESGDYKVRVYLMRNAARRDEIANYRLEMSID
jgi:hypothetical protein